MVNLAYIHKRRARRIIVAIALGCAATALVIGAAAMLGQKSSPFTVKLSNAGANLSLYTKGDDESSESKVYLMAPDVPAYPAELPGHDHHRISAGNSQRDLYGIHAELPAHHQPRHAPHPHFHRYDAVPGPGAAADLPA